LGHAWVTQGSPNPNPKRQRVATNVIVSDRRSREPNDLGKAVPIIG
jgi:hypothetical protein